MPNLHDYVWNHDISPEVRDDFDEHLFENVFAMFAEKLPQNPPAPELRNECPMWCDGVEILCASEWLAETVADIIEAISGEHQAHTGYYDPAEDAVSNEADDHTGWYYVDYD